MPSPRTALPGRSAASRPARRATLPFLFVATLLGGCALPHESRWFPDVDVVARSVATGSLRAVAATDDVPEQLIVRIDIDRDAVLDLALELAPPGGWPEPGATDAAEVTAASAAPLFDLLTLEPLGPVDRFDFEVERVITAWDEPLWTGRLEIAGPLAPRLQDCAVADDQVFALLNGREALAPPRAAARGLRTQLEAAAAVDWHVLLPLRDPLASRLPGTVLAVLTPDAAAAGPLDFDRADLLVRVGERPPFDHVRVPARVAVALSGARADDTSVLARYRVVHTCRAQRLAAVDELGLPLRPPLHPRAVRLMARVERLVVYSDLEVALADIRGWLRDTVVETLLELLIPGYHRNADRDPREPQRRR